jgi:voltage-gated potassium channel
MRKRIFETLEATNEQNKFSRIYDCFMIVCITISLVPLFFKQSNVVFLHMEKITAVVFALDYILRWITFDFKLEKLGGFAFVVYPVTFFAIIDMLSILPSFALLHSGFKVLRVLRLAKAFKVFKLLRYSKSFSTIVLVIKREKKALSAVCVMAVGYIFVSALVMFQVEPDSFDTFFDAIYWAVVTLTTVGYGDIYPISDIGRIVSMFSSFMGIAIVALPTGIITAGYMSELENEKDIDNN